MRIMLYNMAFNCTNNIETLEILNRSIQKIVVAVLVIMIILMTREAMQ